MKKLFILSFITLSLIACTQKNKPAEEEKVVIEMQGNRQSDLPLLRQAVQMNPLDGFFFAAHKEGQTAVFILDESNFQRVFKPAATMKNRPLKIDFTKEEVAAIVLPETPYDTQIILDSAYIENKVMHVIYQVEKGVEKRSFTIQPVKLFTFDINLEVDSVSFENAGVKLIVPDPF